MDKILNEILNTNKNYLDIRAYSPLALAYIGDSVFDICVKTYILKKINTNPNKLHNLSTQYINAITQSKMYYYIIDKISEEEINVLKRGRNAKGRISKSASLKEYKNATGLEALFGYLYLKGEIKRITEIFELCLKSFEITGENNEEK